MGTSMEVIFNFTSSTVVTSFFCFLFAYFLFAICFFIGPAPEFIFVKMTKKLDSPLSDFSPREWFEFLSMIIFLVFTFIVVFIRMDQHNTFDIKQFFVVSAVCLVLCIIFILYKLFMIIVNFRGFYFLSEVVFIVFSFIILSFGFLILIHTFGLHNI